MKSNQKKESGSNDEVNIKKGNTLLPESPTKGNDKSKNEGEEHKGEGHGHDYSVPVAGEDGGTEEQSGSKSKKTGKNPDKIQPAEQGKTPGEQPSI
jgi:hypothetical protein